MTDDLRGTIFLRQLHKGCPIIDTTRHFINNAMRRSAIAFVAFILIGDEPIVHGLSNPSARTVKNGVQSCCRKTAMLAAFATSSMEQEKSLVEDTDCPSGYYYNAVKSTCNHLGPIGRVSQAVETFGPFKKAYTAISDLFGIDAKRISNLGVSFALSYSMISQINASITFSVAWYLSSKRTGLSPLVPGEWKSLLTAYATIYGIIQVLKPFRVAAAIGMSKLSKEFLDATEKKLNCKRRTAIFFQYALGWMIWLCLATVGVTIASTASGVPLLATQH
ncbi:unnamed protein product [Cylindrotheca closterium]|uniref:Uncharacterized protein n=1 Tax=Cylindrotheca closterium TaxID=2856 RepID=A0AAD2FUF6_9STRA|nr:unnamed protein product [Cylindrotheca closterium]